MGPRPLAVEVEIESTDLEWIGEAIASEDGSLFIIIHFYSTVFLLLSSQPFVWERLINTIELYLYELKFVILICSKFNIWIYICLVFLFTYICFIYFLLVDRSFIIQYKRYFFNYLYI